MLPAGAAVAAVVVWAVGRPAVDGDARAQMRAAAAWADSTVAAVRDPTGQHTSDTAVLALGYLERLRLGLGSPFRLVDYALHDVRLSDATRRRVAWALLDRTLAGDAYVIDPGVLAAGGSRADSAAASRQLRLIEQTVAAADEPRRGETAVRLAYALAAGERTLDGGTAAVADEAAALARDRSLAREDARSLFRRARTDRVSVFDELQTMRSERELAVETPPLSVPAALDERTLAAARRLLDSLRVSGGGDPSIRPPSWFAPAVARRLVILGSRMPPEAVVVVPLRVYRSPLLDAGASNEETLAGAYALTSPSHGGAAQPAVALLASATALRALAQEEAWFPGMPAPTEGMLRAEFGLESVTFENAVPLAWRPYYLRQLQASLRDFDHVLPAMSVEGLRVRFVAGGLMDNALAMHDPSTRTIRLSIRTSAGTLAHELAHDLDWQAARRLYAGVGYSSDRAMHDGRGPLSRSMRGLAAARPGTQMPSAMPKEIERPAELFARGIDWFVARSLASQGQWDGALSSAQDALLTGYAGAAPALPDVAPHAGAALLDALEEMTAVPVRLRDRFLADAGDAAAVDPSLTVRELLALAPPRRRAALWIGGAETPAALAGVPNVCVSAPPGSGEELQARAALMDLALAARARGLLRQRARWMAPERRPAWAHAVLGDAPWNAAGAADAVARVRAVLAVELERVSGTATFASMFPVVSMGERCGH